MEETQKNQEPASKPQSEEPVVTPPAPQPEQSSQSEVESSTEGDSSKASTLPSSDDDPDVVRSEINDIRKSVVSMSVGQPDRTTTIVKEWLEQPEPTPPAEPEQEAASDSDGGDTEEKEK